MIDWVYVRWSLCIFLLYRIVICCSATQKDIDLAGQEKVLINHYTEVFHSSDHLSGQEAWEKIVRGDLSESHKKINPGMSFPKDSYWIVFSINNDSQELVTQYLEIDYPQLDFIELFAYDGQKMDSLFTTGDQFLFDQRPVIHRNFVLPLVLSAQNTTTYLLHLQKFESTVRFPMYLHSEKGFIKEQFVENLQYSLYFGFIALVSIAALVLGFIVNVGTFKVYAFYVLAFSFWLFTRLGYSYQFIISDFPKFNTHLLPAAGQLAVMGLILYVRSFFKTRESLPRFHQLMNVILLIFALSYIVWIIIPDEFVAFATKIFIFRYLFFSTAIIFAFSAAINYRKTDRFRAYMFLWAYSLFLLSIFGKIAAEYGISHEQTWQFDPTLIGFLVEVIVLSTAMVILLKRTLLKSQSVAIANEDLKAMLHAKENIEKSGYIKLNSKAVIPTKEIQHIKSDDHYLEFYISDNRKEIDRNLIARLLEVLPNNFIQTHRSSIVNLDAVKALYSDKILLHTGEEVKLSRTYKKKFQQLLKKLPKA